MRRPSAKGKGADIFFEDVSAEETAAQETAPGHRPAARAARQQPKGKASFYFTGTLLDRLDQAWMRLRMVDRRITKSELVQAALEEMLDEYEQRGEESKLYQRLIGLG